MAAGRILRYLSVVAVVVLGSGCTLYQPRPVTFQVRDGDTGKPVAGAKVETYYRTMMDFGVLLGSVGPTDGVTDADGNLTLIVDPTKTQFFLRLSADGYPELETGRATWGGAPYKGRLLPRPWYAIGDDYLVQMFRGPQATADVTVPDGYRGVVLVRFAPEGSPPPRPGQRSFAYTATPRGRVNVRETDLFLCAAGYEDVRARYPDGATFPTVVPASYRPAPPSATSDDTVALRYVTDDWSGKERAWLYVLGTADEAAAVRKQVYPDDDHFDDAAFRRIVEGR